MPLKNDAVTADSQSPVIVPDIIEEAKQKTGKIQSFYANLSDGIFSSDTLFKLFKRAELDASMAAASSGAFYSYWTIDKLLELNNVVDDADKTPGSCPDALKNIFTKSKNPRIRGNRVGQLILDHVTAMMEQGGGGGSIGSTGGAASAPTPSVSMPAATVAAAVAPTMASSRPSTSSGGGEDNMLDGHSLVRYVFSPELPFDAQLRIRGAPSGDGEILGTVNPDDVIWGSPSVTSGSYLRVKVDGRTHEAWMQTSGGGQQFLVTENERAAMQGSSGGGGGGDMAMAAPPATAPASMPSYQAEIGGPQMSISTPGHGMMMARPVTAPVMGGGMGMNQSVMMSPARSMPQMFSSMGQGMNGTQLNMSMAPDAAMQGQPVPYEVYRRLEIRVNQLEAEFNNLKMALRSV